MSHRRSSPAIFFGLAAVVAARVVGIDLASPGATIAACAAIAVFGLPHGTFDLQLIRRQRGAGQSMAWLAALYVGCGAAMFSLWRVDAVLALVAFLLISVVHFAEDWEELDSGFLRAGLAAALLCAPAYLHKSQLGEIFSIMTLSDGRIVADGLLLVAPLSSMIGLVAIVALFKAGRRDLGFGASTALAAMVVMPPAVGFALFFCLLHSPRHFAAGLDRLAWRGAAQWPGRHPADADGGRGRRRDFPASGAG